MPQSKQLLLKSTVLVSTVEDPGWLSLRRIRQNVLAAYRFSSPSPRLITSKWRSVEVRSLARAVQNGPVDRLVFLVSNPRINGLSQIRNKAAERCFHIFGDFTRLTPEWRASILSLVGTRTRFITASQAQKRQMTVFLGNQNRANVDVVPFPVTWTLPQPLSERQDKRWRDGWGFEKGDFVITYAGRVSQQKNVNLLLKFVQMFIKANPEEGKKIKIAIAGGFDDIGQYFLNHEFRPREYSDLWTSWFESLPQDFRSRICFLDFLNPQALERLYSISGVFSSLSTFHDEDFGMAPLEALAAGCPAILSAWGGYEDFAKKSRHARLVTIQSSQNGLALDYRRFESSLLYFIRQAQSRKCASFRRERADYFRERYSIESISRQLFKVHARRAPILSSPSPILGKHADLVKEMRRGRGQVYRTLSARDPFYKQIYDCYVASTGR